MSPTLYAWTAALSTALSMLAFVGVVVWSYSTRRANDFAAAANLPLEEDTPPIPGAQS